MRVTQTISIGTLRINSMSNSSIVQIGTSGAVKTRSEEITEVIPQAEANQQLETKIYNSVKPHLAKEGIPTVQQPLGKSDTGWNGPEPEPKATGKPSAGTGGGAGHAPITGGTSGAAHGDIGTEGSPNGAQQGGGGGTTGSAGGTMGSTGGTTGSTGGTTGSAGGAGNGNGNGNSSGRANGAGIDSSSWYVDGDANRAGRRRGRS